MKKKIFTWLLFEQYTYSGSNENMENILDAIPIVYVRDDSNLDLLWQWRQRDLEFIFEVKLLALD